MFSTYGFENWACHSRPSVITEPELCAAEAVCLPSNVSSMDLHLQVAEENERRDTQQVSITTAALGLLRPSSAGEMTFSRETRPDMAASASTTPTWHEMKALQGVNGA